MINKILIVGGTFDRNTGKPSSLIQKMYIQLKEYCDVEIFNGGNVEQLQGILESTPSYNCVFWFANVDNSEEKIRNVKEYAPHTLLITSKRNDNQKYNFEELIQRALANKSNLCYEFSKDDTDGKFNIRVFDPLGCVWFNGKDINKAIISTMNRINYLSSVTRKPSVRVDTNIDVIFTDKDKQFLEFVKTSANTFHKLMCLPPDVKRFVGNASLRFKEPTRCMNGFPAIRKDDIVLISRRNVDKTGISEKDFIPCYLDDNENVAYIGENKPSVDSPVQLRLFKQLNNIDYILHGHCYIENAPMTSIAIPCGAIEEVNEVVTCIKEVYNTLDKTFYAINLKGHGCLIMANSERLDDMKKVTFINRSIPEIV